LNRRDTRWLIGLGLGLCVGLALAFELRIPFPLALIAGAATLFGTVMLTAPKKPAKPAAPWDAPLDPATGLPTDDPEKAREMAARGLDPRTGLPLDPASARKIEAPPVETPTPTPSPAVAQVMLDGQQALDRLRAARLRLPPGDLAGSLIRIENRAERFIADLARDPSDLAHVQRPLLYFLPRTADMAATYLQIDRASEAGRAKAEDVTSICARLAGVFDKAAADMEGADLQALDLEMRLIRDAIDEELPR
jgi:hypothetical protein